MSIRIQTTDTNDRSLLVRRESDRDRAEELGDLVRREAMPLPERWMFVTRAGVVFSRTDLRLIADLIEYSEHFE